MTDRRKMLHDEREALDSAWGVFTKVINAAPGSNEFAAYHSGFRNGWHAFAHWREQGLAAYNAEQLRRQHARWVTSISPGDRVLVCGGPHECREGTVIECGRDRIRIDAIGCAVPIIVDVDDVRILSQADNASADAPGDGDVRECRPDHPAPTPPTRPARPDPREWPTIDAVIEANAEGFELNGEKIAEIRAEQDGLIDVAVRDLVAAGMKRNEIEILVSWGDIKDDGKRISITRTVQVRQRPR